MTGRPTSNQDERPRGLRLGDAIRQARTARGWSREDLAAKAQIAVRTLTRLEAEGTISPSFFLVADLAHALDLELADLDRLARTPPAGLISIGYEGRDIDSFIRELTGSAVSLVADVRLTPLSRKPGFSKTRLGERLGQAGIDYLHLRSLGNPKDNRPPFREGRIEEGRARFGTLLDEPAATAALSELADSAGRRRVAVLCFERDEHHCHRKVVLDRVRQIRDVPVMQLT